MTYNLIIFANQTGNIPLADLDKNFALVANYVESAGTVTSSAQPIITSVGNLTNLNVNGPINSDGITSTSVTVKNNLSNANINLSNGNITITGAIRSDSAVINGTITASSAVVTKGNVTASYFIGDGSQLKNLPGTSNYSNANVQAYLPTYSGQLNNIIIKNGSYYGSGAGLTNVPGSSVNGPVPSSSYAVEAGTVKPGPQPNITAVGTLTSLTVNGTVTAGAVTTNGNISATYFIGDGSKLTNLPGGGNSTYGNSNVAAYLPSYNGQLNGVTINSGKYYGNGAGLTNVLGSVITGTVANANYASQAATVTMASQPAITSVGTLTSLNVVGNVSTTGKFLGDGSGLTSILKSDRTRTVYVSTSAPSNSEGMSGDIWYQIY